MTADASWSRDADDAFWPLVRDRRLPHARLASREPASTGRVRLTLPAGWFGLTSSVDHRRRGNVMFPGAGAGLTIAVRRAGCPADGNCASGQVVAAVGDLRAQ